MTIAFVQEVAHGHNTSGSTTLVLTLSGITTTVGNHLILCSGEQYTCHLNSVADSRSNTWQVDADYSDTAGGDQTSIAVASCRIATALVNGDTITATFSAGSMAHAAVVSEFSGLVQTSWFDVKAGYTSQGATATASDSGATATTAQGDELLIGNTGIGKQNWPTFVAEVLSPVWNLSTHEWCTSNWFGICPMYRIVSATGAYNAKGTWTGAAAWGAIIATYKALSITTWAMAGPQGYSVISTPVGSPGAFAPQGYYTESVPVGDSNPSTPRGGAL